MSSSESTQQTKVGDHTFSMPMKYDFSSSKILGVGSYGVVATACDRASGYREVAIKRVRPFDRSSNHARAILTEIRVMKVLKYHPNVRKEK